MFQYEPHIFWLNMSPCLESRRVKKATSDSLLKQIIMIDGVQLLISSGHGRAMPLSHIIMIAELSHHFLRGSCESEELRIRRKLKRVPLHCMIYHTYKLLRGFQRFETLSNKWTVMIDQLVTLMRKLHFTPNSCFTPSWSVTVSKLWH